jgi:hypothetical protein
MQRHTLLGMQVEDMLHLYSYAFDVLLEEMCYRCFYWKFIHYILFYSWFNTEVQFYAKSLFNWTCGLNNSSEQICLLRCFHLTLALLIPGTWWLLKGKGISCMSHPHSFRSIRAWNLIIWVHLFSFLRIIHVVVVELILLNAFIFIARSLYCC